MASSKICRLSSKFHSLTQKLTKTKVHVSSLPSPIKTPSPSSTTSHINRSFRLPVELSRCVSLLPLHSAIASARLISSLSLDYKRWGLVPQGISMPSMTILLLTNKFPRGLSSENKKFGLFNYNKFSEDKDNKSLGLYRLVSSLIKSKKVLNFGHVFIIKLSCLIFIHFELVLEYISVMLLARL